MHIYLLEISTFHFGDDRFGLYKICVIGIKIKICGRKQTVYVLKNIKFLSL